jgi:cell division septum initiation protein DivIVA
VLSKFENDDREKDLEQLTEANAELLEQNAQLKNALQSLRESKNGPES